MSTHGEEIGHLLLLLLLYIPTKGSTSRLPLVSPLGSTVCQCQGGHAGDPRGVYVAATVILM